MTTWVGTPRRGLAVFGCLARCAALLPGLAAFGRLSRDAGAEHVGADDRDAREDEDPQDREVGEADQHEGQLGQDSLTLVSRRRDMVVLPILIVAPSASVALLDALAVDRASRWWNRGRAR